MEGETDPNRGGLYYCNNHFKIILTKFVKIISKKIYHQIAAHVQIDIHSHFPFVEKPCSFQIIGIVVEKAGRRYTEGGSPKNIAAR